MCVDHATDIFSPDTTNLSQELHVRVIGKEDAESVIVDLRHEVLGDANA